MKKILNLALAIVLVLSLAACGSSSGTAVSPTTAPDPAAPAATSPPAAGPVKKLVAAHVLDQTHPVHQGFVEMDRLLKELSGGAMALDIFPSSALGDEEPTLEAMKMGGTIDLSAPSAAPVSIYAKQFLVCDFPYSFLNYDQVWKFYDGEFGEYLYKQLEGSGIKGLAWWDNGFRNLTTTNKPINSLADLKGMKIRTMSSPVHMASMNALGAAATPVPFGELYSALQQGVAEGQENPVANILGNKFYEVQKYLMMSRHFFDPSPLLISQKTWDSLTPEQQGWVKEAAVKAGEYMRQVSIDEEAEKLAQLEKEGMTVIPFSEEQLKAFQEATKDVYKGFINDVGQDCIDLYMKCIEEVKQ